MKLINKNNLIKKYVTLDDFMEKYYKLDKPKELSKVGIEKLKPGTVLFAKYLKKYTEAVNRGYGKFGLEQHVENAVGHLMIYLGKDESNKGRPFVILENSSLDKNDSRHLLGTGLELTLSYYTKPELNKKSPLWKSVCCIEILDYNKINRM